MKINITSSVSSTPLLRSYATKKIFTLAKLIKHFEENGEVQIRLEIKMSKHHKKGDVCFAVIDAELPKKMLHAEAMGENVRTAIDEARNTLRTEIEKYKSKLLPKRGKV